MHHRIIVLKFRNMNKKGARKRLTLVLKVCPLSQQGTRILIWESAGTAVISF
jgi:hypothetical protein